MKDAVKQTFDAYPEQTRQQLLVMRKLILRAGKDCGAGPISETLKWNEPSYIANKGSTVRLGWKSKHPSSVFVFFHCQTTLIETFKELYGNVFSFEGKRAIVFDIGEKIPDREFKHCVSLALRYHELKHLPLLGA
ncbi:MAG: DUF1801 domain-containing protein [Pseudomonadales bacterium]